MNATPPETPISRWARLNGFPHGRGHGDRERCARWLRERDLSQETLDEPTMPKDPVTVEQWAEFIGENPVTVKSWQRRADWNVQPRVVRPRWAAGSGRKGKTPSIFSLAELEAYPRPRDRRIDPDLFREGEHLTLHSIAVRGGLDHSETLYQYRSYEGFPEPVEGIGGYVTSQTTASAERGSSRTNAQELYDARDVVAWYNRRPGRRGKGRGTKR